MRIALVHEFLTQYGGAERLLEVLHEMFPDAPVYTLVYDKKNTDLRFRNYDVRTSYLQKLYDRFGSYKWMLPLMPKAVQSFDLSEFDIVISDSSAFAKGIKTAPGQKHVCYCHTPTRYIWESRDEYISQLSYAKPIKTLAKYYIQNRLAAWDYLAAQNPHMIVANSHTVKERIKRYYNRDAVVVYPPVDTEFFNGKNGSKGGRGEFYFTASRLEPYKKIDLVVSAFDRLGLRLKVAGTGAQFLNLKSKILNPEIEFLGRVSDTELRSLYQNAKAFIFPSLEDAGLMTLEALASGTPVIGYNRGGTAEFIRDGENGVLFENQSAEDMAEAVKRFGGMEFDPVQLRKTALPYDKKEFKKRILAIIHNS